MDFNKRVLTQTQPYVIPGLHTHLHHPTVCRRRVAGSFKGAELVLPPWGSHSSPSRVLIFLTPSGTYLPFSNEAGALSYWCSCHCSPGPMPGADYSKKYVPTE